MYIETSEEYLKDTSTNAIGLDAAQSDGGDMGGAAHGKKNILKELHEFRCPNASDLAYNIVYTKSELLAKGRIPYFIPTMKQYGVVGANIGVDGVGIGVSTINAFSELGINVKSLIGGADYSRYEKDERGNPKIKFETLRSQMIWELREDLRLKLISVNIADKDTFKRFCEELTAVKYSITGSTIKIEHKEEIRARIGRSTTLLDIAAYWNYSRKLPPYGIGVWDKS